MSSSIRKEVLQAFKKIHRTRRKVFSGDAYALKEARKTINDEYRKNSSLVDSEEIHKALRTSIDAETLLRTTVVQARLKDHQSHVYEVEVTDDTVRNDNHKLGVGTVPDNLRGDLPEKT